MLGVDIYNHFLDSVELEAYEIPLPNKKIDCISDPQSELDRRSILINRVGIKGLKFPARIPNYLQDIYTNMECDLAVSLIPEKRGTHMSRIIKLVEDIGSDLTLENLNNVVMKMCDSLNSDYGQINIRFPYFIKKAAPISKEVSLMDYEVQYIVEMENNEITNTICVQIPVMSLCPCSKAISDYGAHNQRSYITVSIKAPAFYSIDELIKQVELLGSCELYSLLKRDDEKYVTERSYENPKFVEDIIRDVAVFLDNDPCIYGYKVEVENYESIHNHSAYAVIDKK